MARVKGKGAVPLTISPFWLADDLSILASKYRISEQSIEQTLARRGTGASTPSFRGGRPCSPGEEEGA